MQKHGTSASALLPIHAARQLMIIFKLRLTFLPHLQHLMSSPSPLHKFIVNFLMDEVSCTFWTIPLPKSITCWPAGNKSFNKTSIQGILDLTVDMWSHHNRQSWRVLLGECAFTQSDENVTKKLQAYILDVPDILVVCKILINQGDRYHSPGAKPSIAKGLQSSRLLTWSEFSSANAGDFAQIVVDGHTWLSLSLVEIHVWVHQAGDSDLNLGLNSDHHTVGVHRLVSYVCV